MAERAIDKLSRRVIRTTVEDILYKTLTDCEAIYCPECNDDAGDGRANCQLCDGEGVLGGELALAWKLAEANEALVKSNKHVTRLTVQMEQAKLDAQKWERAASWANDCVATVQAELAALRESLRWRGMDQKPDSDAQGMSDEIQIKFLFNGHPYIRIGYWSKDIGWTIYGYASSNLVGWRPLIKG